MKQDRRNVLVAFAAMVFVGASWGANVPVTKVMLDYFDLIPMMALRTATAVVVLGLLLLAVESRLSLRLRIDFPRFLLLGLMMAGFFGLYATGIMFSNPISASTVQVAGPLVASATVWMVTGQRFDPGFGVALFLTVLGGAILVSGSIVGRDPLTLGGGESVVLLSNGLWTLYSIKAQVWFAKGTSQLQRAYVAFLSASAWMCLLAALLIAAGWQASPFGISDGWIWTQFFAVAILAGGLGGYFWNVGASRLGVAIASLWVNLVPFFAVLWSMAYGFVPNAYQIVGGLVALGGVVYMQWRKLSAAQP